MECQLLPAEWLRGWRKYVSPSKARKSDAQAPRPPPLREAFAPLLCDCAEHADRPLLAFPPPALQSRRGRWALEVDEYGLDRNLFAAVSPQEGAALSALYGGDGDAVTVLARAVGDGHTELRLETTPGVCDATVSACLAGPNAAL